MHSSILLALASVGALVGTVNAKVPQGLNCGNKKADGSLKSQTDYESEFTTAQKLAGTNGAFSSARVYTMIQGDAPNNAPIAAIPAAKKTGTTLLLGMWCSGDPAGFQNELAALKNALTTYPDLETFTDGISVGSEDLYRDSPIGIENKSGVGLGPDQLVDYINQVRKVLDANGGKNIKVGHVDTWTAWVNGTNKEVIDACDWVGVDAYPYWQSTMANDISQAGTLFNDAIKNTQNAAGSKPVWVTETGWPVHGNKSNLAEADTKDAQKYYQGVGCKLFGKTPTWWYILNEDGASPDFSIASLSGTPLYDLNCADAKNADPLLAGATSTSSGSNSTSTSAASSGSGSNSTSGGASGGYSSNTTGGSSASATAKPSTASVSQAANCVFALVLAGVVALMI